MNARHIAQVKGGITVRCRSKLISGYNRRAQMALEAGFHIGPYEVLSLLGAGGMGEVYKANDTRLLRAVALKILPADKIADPERKRRFFLEAQAACRLNHPNIVTIYDVIIENELCCIAMEYVAGVTLERLNVRTGLGMEEAMHYACDIADALAAAHAAGIIHRDLKPANIIVADNGRLKLLDFGLAKLVDEVLTTDATETEAGNPRTAAGTIMGTAAYMSPEQAEGRTIDARSDIFSYGLVLYELLCGKPAFRRDSWISTLAAILRDEPETLTTLNPEIPREMALIVTRCLQKDPAQRFQNMNEVKKALLEEPPEPIYSHTKEEPRSIAVLPFVNLSAEKENEYFGDGLAEEIINALAKVPELKVIARTSAFAFRGKENDLRKIGERLGVAAILEGSVRRAGNRIRVTAQLIKTSDESHLWSERYDRDMTDIFAIQDEISQAIANELKVKLTAPRRRTTNIEAFQNYLKGLYWYQRYTPESLAKARESFEESLAHDPGYAPAYSGLAVFYYGLGAIGIKRMVEMAPLARSAAEKALEIDPTQTEAHSVLGLIAGSVEFDWKRAERHFQTAMAVDPVPPLVHVRYGLYYLTPLGRYAEAAIQYRKALETDPLSMMVHFCLAFALYCDRRYDEAIEHAATAVALYPDYWLVHFAMGLALSQKGLFAQAIESLETTLRLSPSFAMSAGFLAAAYARSGDPSRAEKLIEEIRQKGTRQYVSPVCFGIYYAAVGQVNMMCDSLNAAFTDRDPYLTRVNAEQYFEAYRSDTRYLELMKRMNLG